MAAGLQVWDSSGYLIIDTSYRILKFLGTLSVGTGYTGTTASGSITIPNAYGNTPFFARIDGQWNQDNYDAVFSISGNTLTWEFPSTGRPAQTVIYGIF